MNKARVSIGLPVYNGAAYLRTAVDAILAQDFEDFELIISDNASTDETPSICRQYAAADSRVRYFRNATNIGAGPNCRRVFELARCGLFTWATHDDVHLPGFLRRCVDVMEQAPPSVVLVAPKTQIIDERGQKLAKNWSVERLDTRYQQPHRRVAHVMRNVEWATAQFGIYRTDRLRQTRLIDSFPCSDHVLLLEVAILGEIWEIPEVLFQRRFHSGISNLANKTQAEFLEWFDPLQKPKRRLWPRFGHTLQPRWRLLWELVRSIRRLPLARTERLLCYIGVCWIWSLREGSRLSRGYGLRLRDRLATLLPAIAKPGRSLGRP